MKGRIVIVLALVLLVFVGNAVAHVPIGAGENNSPETAIEIKEPTKSWAIYDEIHEAGEAKYYRFNMESGQRLTVSLFTPEKNFAPGVVIMGIGVTASGNLPRSVELPSGYSAMVFEGKQTNSKKYEPFTPTSYYYTADVDMKVNATGTYYVAVYNESQGGKVGIAIGYVETFSLTEWLRIPIDAINIHTWEGQNIIVVLAPLFVITIVGIAAVIWILKKKGISLANILMWLGVLAALLFMGSGVLLLTQMIIALAASSIEPLVIVTLLFGFLPILFGALLLRISMRIQKEMNKKTRAKILICGILGLVLWSGVIIGPILAIVTSLLPHGINKIKS